MHEDLKKLLMNVTACMTNKNSTTVSSSIMKKNLLNTTRNGYMYINISRIMWMEIVLLERLMQNYAEALLNIFRNLQIV